LTPILSLGDLYVSDFVDPTKPDGLKAPLELVLCHRCRLLQLRHTVPAEALYHNYWYFSGTNQTMRSALKNVSNTAETLIHLKENDAVLDIGCNDGTLLASYETRGIYKIGFDPAKNISSYSSKVTDKLVVDFFNSTVWERDPELSKRRPKIITSIAMFYDLEDPNSFVNDIHKVIHPDGLWIVQMSYLPLMLATNELGNICHEHLEYYSLYSFEYLLKRHGLEIVDLELNDINGGSVRAYIRLKGSEPSTFGDATYRELAQVRLRAFREKERSMGLESLSPYTDFAFRIQRIKNDVVDFIKEQHSRGKKIFVYGASTKGNTLLQYYGLDSTIITAASERSPDKWGKVTVGSRIPIVSEDDARAAKPDFFLVLPWHFIDEFQVREREYLFNGGRFILPAPYFSLR
jgi:SAM-dependent methyltransferase